jgi:hypothetical protein
MPACDTLVLLDGRIVLKGLVQEDPVMHGIPALFDQPASLVTIYSRRKRRNAVIAMIKAPMMNNIPTILKRERDPSWVKTIPIDTANRATTIA